LKTILTMTNNSTVNTI